MPPVTVVIFTEVLVAVYTHVPMAPACVIIPEELIKAELSFALNVPPVTLYPLSTDVVLPAGPTMATLSPIAQGIEMLIPAPFKYNKELLNPKRTLVNPAWVNNKPSTSGIADPLANLNAASVVAGI